MNAFRLAAVVALIFVFSECSSPEPSYHRNTVSTNCAPKTTLNLANVTAYQGTNAGDTYVKTILDRSCGTNSGGCHSGGTSQARQLQDYAAVNNATKMTTVLARINQNQGTNGFMPQGGTKLVQAELDLIKNWNTAGRPQFALVASPSPSPSGSPSASPTPSPVASSAPKTTEVKPSASPSSSDATKCN